MWLNCVYKFDCVSLLLGKLQKGIILYLKNPVKKLVYGVSQLALSEHHLLCSLWRFGLLTFLCLDFSSFFSCLSLLPFCVWLFCSSNFALSPLLLENDIKFHYKIILSGQKHRQTKKQRNPDWLRWREINIDCDIPRYR